MGVLKRAGLVAHMLGVPLVYAWKSRDVGTGAPVTDDGVKRSAKGRLSVVLDDDGRLSLINDATPEQEAVSLLQSVWRNGRFVQRWTFDQVRARARAK